jgi:hypothetical protein
MIRVILAAALSILILGGLSLFMERRGRSAGHEVVRQESQEAAGRFSLDVTLSFSPAAEDPFALVTKEAKAKPGLLVQLNGQEVISVSEDVPVGELITRDDVPGVVVGANEVLIEADPPLAEANRAHAVRVRMLRDGKPIAEQTSWSEPGARLVAQLRLNVPAEKPAAEIGHD